VASQVRKSERAWKEHFYFHRRPESGIAWWAIFYFDDKGIKGAVQEAEEKK